MVPSRRIGQFLLLACLLVPVVAPASTVEVTGAPGIAGTDGDAGNPAGNGGDGGPGGDGVAIAATPGDADNTAIATGGSGGQGGRGGDGEDPNDPEAPVAGGNGGATGAGGGAFATATTVTETGNGAATARAFGQSGYWGGIGGNGTGGAPDGTRGPQGLNGNATAAATAVAPDDVRISVWAAGGSTYFLQPDAAGIAGGKASLGPVFGTSTNGGKVSIVGRVNGGDALGPGAAGADALLDNAIDGSTTGTLDLYQIATSGATEDHDVPAGEARSRLSKSGSFEQLQLTAEAVAGEGSLGANATGIAVAENATGRAIADARGYANGASNAPTGGRAGDGSAWAEARSAGTEWAIASADSSGGEHGDPSGAIVGTGGAARSTAIASQTGTSNAYADSIARGGRGGIAGGDATAMAEATAASGGASANVFADGGVADGTIGRATGQAILTVRGDQTSASAWTRARGGAGSARTEIDIAGGAISAGLVTVHAPVASDGKTTATAGTLANARMAQQFAAPPAADDLLTRQSGAKASLLPGTALVAGAVAANPEAAAAIGTARPGLLHAILGGGYAPDGSGGAFTYSSSIALSFDPAQLGEGDNLLLLLLDPASTGLGFDALHFRVMLEDAAVVDQTFTDVATALSFFDDQVFDLGNWRLGLEGDMDLKFMLDLTASRPGDAFYASFLATTVPLPPSAVLLGTAIAAGLGRRKWRR